MTYLLGIDVGTTRTAAAIARLGARQGEAEIVNLGDRASAVPSVLYVDDDGTLVVGEAAERRAVTDPDHVAREFKRRIGDPTPVVVAGRPWAPEELSARLVRWVVDRVAQREGGRPARIAVTHPASWGPHKKERFGGALAAQGISVTFLAEPQAAALHYAAAERVESGSTIAVYDFGGGTFDAAVVHKDGQGFSLLGRPEGVERLGGIDFDEVVFEHVMQGLPEAFEGLDESDPAVLSAVAAIRRECTEAKEALSSDTEVAIPVFTPAGQGSVRLHRSEFEAAIRPQVEETVEALRRAITSAGLVPAQLSAVLLVGGSSRIPLVGQMVSEQLGRPVAVDADPKNAIAMGAALSLAPQVPAPRAAGSARFPVTASAPPFGTAGGAGFGAAGAQMSAGLPPTGPGQSGGSYGPGAAGPSVTGTHRPGGYDSGSHAPPTQRLGGSTGPRAAGAGMMSMPPPRPGYGEADHGGEPPYDYDYAPEQGRGGGRSPAWLVSVGGAAAAVAVIAAALLWPSTTPVRADHGSPAGPSVPSQAVTEPSSDATDEPAGPAEEPTRGNRPAPSATRPAPAHVTSVAPPPVTTTPPSVTTTTPPPVTTTPPPVTTTPPPVTTTTVGPGASGGADEPGAPV